MRKLSIGAVLFLACAGVARVHAANQITTTGSEEIRRTPDHMRMRVELLADGKDMKEALAALTAKRDAFKQKLNATSPAHVNVGNAQIASDEDPRRRFGMMGNAPAQNGPPRIKLTQTIKADWPLTGAAAEDRMLAAADLQQHLKADAPSKTAAPTTQTEEQEEMAAAAQAGGMPTPETPVFTFAATIPDADRTKAIAAAFNKAKADASTLANAIGATLGAPSDIKAQISPLMDKPADPQEAYMEAVLGAMQTSPSQERPSATEATGNQPAEVGLTVSVTASFAFMQ